MSEAIKRLQEERRKVWQDMRDILSSAEGETRSLTAEETTRYKALETDLRSKGEEIELRERNAGIAAALAAPAPTPGVPSGDEQRDGNADVTRRDAYAKAFGGYLRSGHSLRAELRSALEAGSVETRDMGVAAGAAGGYLVPPGFLAKITEIQKWYGGVRKVANVIETTTGNSMVWPSNDDTGNPAVIIGENTTVTERDLGFGNNTLAAFMWTTGAVRVGRALMQDSAFDLEAVIANRFAKRFGRGQNTAFTTGAGISGGLTAVTSALTLAGAAITYANLLAVTHSIDPAYRASPNTAWMMSDSALAAVQGIADGNGRPLFVPAGSFGSIASAPGGPNGSTSFGSDTLLGYPIVINNDLAVVQATGGGVCAIFGDFNAGYIVRDVADSTATLRLEERYADSGEIGFIGYMRSDGQRDDPNALRAITNHA